MIISATVTASTVTARVMVTVTVTVTVPDDSESEAQRHCPGRAVPGARAWAVGLGDLLPGVTA